MYEVTTDEQSQAQLDALPPPALAPFAEARAALELAPWNGEPYHRRSPDSPMRTLLFGPGREGKIVYLILEPQRRVDLLVVLLARLNFQQRSRIRPCGRPGAH